MERRRHRIEPSQLIVRYALALGLIVVFVLGGHGLHIMTSKQGVLDEEVLNISGRQRMLSQRVVLLGHRFYESTEEEAAEYAALLAESIDAFEAGHLWVIENAVMPQSAPAQHYYAPIGEPGGADLDAPSRAT